MDSRLWIPYTSATRPHCILSFHTKTPRPNHHLESERSCRNHTILWRNRREHSSPLQIRSFESWLRYDPSWRPSKICSEQDCKHFGTKAPGNFEGRLDSFGKVALLQQVADLRSRFDSYHSRAKDRHLKQ